MNNCRNSKRSRCRLRGAALLCLSLSTLVSAATPEPQRFGFVAHYQGVLSLGLALDIADVVIELPAVAATTEIETANLALNSAAYSKMETLLPLRLCYRSQFNSTHATTQVAEWWNRIGRKLGHGRLDFDASQHRVLRRHAEARSNGINSEGDRLAQRLITSSRQIPDQDWMTAPFTGPTPPLDRLGLLQWLRYQQLPVGANWEVAVSDGYKLTGYTITVEGVETLTGPRGAQPCTRLRLTPQLRDETERRPVWLWLTQDPARWPMLLRSRTVLGEFSAWLTSTQAPTAACNLPTSGLELPPP